MSWLTDIWGKVSVYAHNFILLCPYCGSSYATLNYDLVHPTDMSLTLKKMKYTLKAYDYSRITCDYCNKNYAPRELKIESLH